MRQNNKQITRFDTRGARGVCEEGDLKAISNVVSGGINNKILGQTIVKERAGCVGHGSSGTLGLISGKYTNSFTGFRPQTRVTLSLGTKPPTPTVSEGRDN
ncbi:hypothetical protein VTN31DRAFT_2123 [Thermomyces dupontii]|uniref:uncharacterized protein n=1 Tax=Talaromyces thermophilus TaxID=28565 RepID=UPI00374348D1